MEIKQIKAKDTQDIRHRVLRPEQPEENAIYPNDEMEGTFHLGAFEKDVLLGVASFYPEKSAIINNPAQYRIRGVATERRMRLKGLAQHYLQKVKRKFGSTAQILFGAMRGLSLLVFMKNMAIVKLANRLSFLALANTT